MTSWLLVAAAAVVMGLGGLLLGLAFRKLGAAAPTLAFGLAWITHPLVLVALVLGIGARLLSYALFTHFNVSQVTLLSALSIVATLVMARAFLGERLTGVEIVGGALIVVGVALVGR